jgi:hypothetical protein
MSYATFPTLPGVTWDIKKRQFWSTDIETSASGAEFRTAYWTAPIYEFDMTFAYLSQADMVTLQNFYATVQGPFTPFYLAVPNDPASPVLVRFRDDTSSTPGAMEINQLWSGGYEQTLLTFRTFR